MQSMWFDKNLKFLTFPLLCLPWFVAQKTQFHRKRWGYIFTKQSSFTLYKQQSPPFCAKNASFKSAVNYCMDQAFLRRLLEWPKWNCFELKIMLGDRHWSWGNPKWRSSLKTSRDCALSSEVFRHDIQLFGNLKSQSGDQENFWYRLSCGQK